MPHFRLYIFDFDGTLADTVPWLFSLMDQLAERYGLKKVPVAERPRLRDLTARQIMEKLGLPLWRLPLVAGHVRRLMAAQTGSLHLFPGIPEMLARLASGGAQLAVVSSNSEANVRAVLGPDNAAHIAHFDCGASLFGKAGKFRHTLRVTDSKPTETLCVGDELRDLEAAQKAGLPFGAVTWGYATVAALQAAGPAFLFRDSSEIQ